MRSKDEILRDLMHDIADVQAPATRLELLLSITNEALIDIRDMLDTRLGILFNLLLDWKDKLSKPPTP